MKRARAFEIVIILLLIVCAGLLYYAIVASQPISESWEIQANDSIDYMFLGSNDTLYTFHGNNITAILPDGSRKWMVAVPEEYRVLNTYTWDIGVFSTVNEQYSNYQAYPIAEERGGHVYVYAWPEWSEEDIAVLQKNGYVNHTSKILAISPKGTIDWEYPVTQNATFGNRGTGGVVSISSHDGRLFVYHDHQEDVLEANGKFLFTLPEVAGPVAVDNDGCIYAVTANKSYENTMAVYNNGSYEIASVLYTVSPSGKVLPDSDPAPRRITIRETDKADAPESYQQLTATARNNSIGWMDVLHDSQWDNWANGTLRGTWPAIAIPVVTGENGTIYAVKAIWYCNGTDDQVIFIDARPLTGYRTYSLLPSSIVQCYDSAGNLLWARDLGEQIYQQETVQAVWPEYYTLPIYRNHSLYVFLHSGAAALDTGGNVRWIKHLSDGVYNPFKLMPVDDEGNVYLHRGDNLPLEYVSSISPEGNVYSDAWAYQHESWWLGREPGPIPVYGNNGVIYAIGSDDAAGSTEFGYLAGQSYIPSDTLTAYDVKNNRAIWSFTIPPEDRKTLTLSRDNLKEAFYGQMYGEVNSTAYDEDPGPERMVYWHVADYNGINVCPGENFTYVYYYYTAFEEPTILNQSKCTYARGLYMLDNEGHLIQELPLNNYIAMMAANNSTIYYSTPDGRLGGVSANVAAGIAAVAILYLFLRFFVVGAVSRAKSRLDKNENRNTVHRYITDNPGTTLADVARELGLNPGTARYHLLVLSLNHRIVAHQDTKFIRYFPKTSMFGDQERSLLSVARRKPLARLLSTIAKKPGLSNLELSRELQLSAAATHEQVTELVSRGILVKMPKPDGEYAYSIKAEYRETIVKAINGI